MTKRDKTELVGFRIPNTEKVLRFYFIRCHSVTESKIRQQVKRLSACFFIETRPEPLPERAYTQPKFIPKQ